jgi:hypothetical protein
MVNKNDKATPSIILGHVVVVVFLGKTAREIPKTPWGAHFGLALWRARHSLSSSLQALFACFIVKRRAH